VHDLTSEVHGESETLVLVATTARAGW